MPITKSAKKALRQNKTRRIRNLQKKKKIKLLFKKIVAFSKQKKEKQAQEILPQYYKAIDKAIKTGLIKKNTASRKKSRLTKAINKIQS
ncbi:MAG: 30S ribosomal protein S20 [Methanosarcinales archaeon]|nr:30S ribosomal protein S20 [Methanosarcinales archaeon]